MSDFNLEVDIPNAARWPLKSADSLCSVISRGTAPVYVEESEVRAIGQRCVSSRGFIAEHARPHSESAVSGVLRPESGDVLLNSTGTGTIGRSVIFDSPGKFIVDGHVTLMRPRRDSADGRWLNSVLQTPHAQRHLERFCYAGSTNQLELSRTPLRLSQIPTPSLNEQEIIGSVVDTLDAAIHETEALIAKLKAVKHGLLHDLLTRGIDANGELRPPQSEAPHLYKPSSLGLIPAGWDTKCISELLADLDPSMRSGPFGSALLKHELVDDGFPLLGIDNVHTERFASDYARFVTPMKFAQLARYAVRPDDLMITIMGTVGRCCLVPGNIGHALSSKHTWTITLDHDAYSPYLAMLQINYSPWVLAHFARDQQGGTMAAIRSDTLRSTLLPVPPREEQRLMEQRLRTLSERIESEATSLTKRRAEKAGLMDDLLTGRVRVTPLLDAATA
ncbi:restriction endonuclease subunit S [Xanthomonas sacchari]|uniref:restriction endonuclease subunit S n=1 Tax=Xanthomonas sacchari TaxID=56458 RepID=UPI0022572BFB|nr:restriction endonuclease subunit S [Xanthomonas sacchari]MCW0412926.1 hypothetical protein [Xanthomonas sacchari]UYK65724.1 restriction endonuclease subunit S [Xanthomonas sacchari]